MSRCIFTICGNLELMEELMKDKWLHRLWFMDVPCFIYSHPVLDIWVVRPLPHPASILVFLLYTMLHWTFMYSYVSHIYLQEYLCKKISTKENTGSGHMYPLNLLYYPPKILCKFTLTLAVFEMTCPSYASTTVFKTVFIRWV